MVSTVVLDGRRALVLSASLILLTQRLVHAPLASPRVLTQRQALERFALPTSFPFACGFGKVLQDDVVAE